jgi:hypothetical protein
MLYFVLMQALFPPDLVPSPSKRFTEASVENTLAMPVEPIQDSYDTVPIRMASPSRQHRESDAYRAAVIRDVPFDSKSTAHDVYSPKARDIASPRFKFNESSPAMPLRSDAGQALAQDSTLRSDFPAHDPEVYRVNAARAFIRPFSPSKPAPRSSPRSPASPASPAVAPASRSPTETSPSLYGVLYSF